MEGRNDHGDGATTGFDAAWLLDQLGEAVLAADAAGSIRYANVVACKLLGYPVDALVGLPLSAIVPPRLRPQHLAGFSRLLATRHPRLAGGRPVQVSALRSDGTEVAVELTLVVDRLDDPEQLVAIAVLRDASERVALERELDAARYLRASLEVADRLQRAASVDEAYAGVLPALCARLDWDMGAIWRRGEDDAIVVRETWHADSPGLAGFELATRATRLAAGGGLPGRCFLTGEPVWAEDLALLERLPRRQAAFAAGLRTGVAFPLLGGRGVLAVVELCSHQARPADEELCRLLGTIGRQLGQVLERVKAEADLRYRAALLASQYEAMSDAMLVVSPDRRVLAYNRRFLELFGVTEDEVHVGAPTPVTIPTMAAKVADLPRARARVDAAHENRDEIVESEIELHDGRIVEVYGAPVVDAEGTYHGRAWYLRDVTEHRRAVGAIASLAETLQRSLLPPRVPDIAGLDLAGMFRAGGEGVDVGGDFYDVFAVGPADWAFVIGDVCGKGAAAATVTALARYTARAEALHVRSPAKVLAMVNRALLQEERDPPFLTAAYLSLRAVDAGFLATVATAGHPLPLLLEPSGHVRALGEPGTLLGVLRDVQLTESTRRLHPGDVIVLFTDGVTEARDRNGREFGLHNLAEVLRARAGEPAQAVVDGVDAALRAHRGETSRDDVALLVVRVR